MTIYVRKEEEKAYNALMLDNLTLEELKESVSVVLEICGLMRILFNARETNTLNS